MKLLFLLLLYVAISFSQKHELPTNLVSVPLIRQGTRYTCGVSATQSLITYWTDDDYLEQDLAKILKSDPENGTTVANIESFLINQHYVVETKVNAEIEDLMKSIDKKYPVMVLIQAWPETPVSDWSKDWNDGNRIAHGCG